MKRAAVKRWCWLLTGLKLDIHISPNAVSPRLSNIIRLSEAMRLLLDVQMCGCRWGSQQRTPEKEE